MHRFIERGGLWVVAQALLLAVVFAAPFFVPGRWLPWPTGSMLPRVVLGTLLLLAGLLMIVAGFVWLGRNVTPMPKPKEDASLVTEGVYAKVRHPLYGGIILVSLGWALGASSIMPLVGPVILAIFFDSKASREERWLTQRYPDYAGYRWGTKKLIPFVY